MENEYKWSWKVLENAREKVLESHGRSISLFCSHPVVLILNSTSSFCYHKPQKDKSKCLVILNIIMSDETSRTVIVEPVHRRLRIHYLPF